MKIYIKLVQDDQSHKILLQQDHCLRLKLDAPAQKSMDYFFDNYEQRKKFRGRPRETLVKTLEKDIMILKQKDALLMPVKKLKDSIDLSTLRQLADDRMRWKKIVELIAESH